MRIRHWSKLIKELPPANFVKRMLTCSGDLLTSRALSNIHLPHWNVSPEITAETTPHLANCWNDTLIFSRSRWTKA